MTSRLRILLAAFLLLATVAEAKRRSAFAPGGTQFTAYPLHSLELTADRSDLWPLRGIVGSANIVALGDVTHGTHEVYTVRLRTIDYLVNELHFDVLALEMPFAITERLNVYVQGGNGDPRAILSELNTRLAYFFHDVEEVLAVIEWVRAYNAHRGDRPPIEIAGADIYDYAGAVTMVVDYLRGVAPEAAAEAERDYACVLGPRTPNPTCQNNATRLRNSLMLRGGSGRAYDDALHAADVVLQNFHLQFNEPREYSMAANLLWIQSHRGQRGRVIYWVHQEHAGKLDSIYTRGVTMGKVVAQERGSEYVAIGTLIGSGTFLQWERANDQWHESPVTLEDPVAGMYELEMRRRGHRAMLIPLRGRNVPGSSFRTAATTSGWRMIEQSLSEKLDAVIYIDRSTVTKPLR